MKYTLLPALIMCCFFANGQGGAFKIKGHVSGWTGKEPILFTYVENGKIIMDSAIAVDGHFEFSGTVIQPVKAGVSARNRRIQSNMLDHRMFFLGSGTVTITAKDSLYKATVEGGSVNRDDEILSQRIAPVLERRAEVKGLAMKLAKESTATPEFKALEKEYQALGDSMDAIRITFIKSNPASFISLDALQMVAGNAMNYDKVSPLFNGLSPELRNTPMGKEMEQKLSKAKITNIGVILPAFESSDTSGHRLKLEDVVKKGKVTLVDFWASWCGPCRKENPNVVKAFTAFHDKGFNIISVSLDKSAELWKKAIIKDGMPWYHVSELKFWDDPIAKMYGIAAIPDNFLLDENGRIIGRGMRGEALYKKIESIVN